MLVWRMMVELLAWVSRFPAEVDVQRTSDGTCHYWVRNMSRSPIVQWARNAEDIPRFRHTGRCREICCRQCLSNRVHWMSTVRQFIWERLSESTNYILEVVKLNNIHLFNTPHKRQRTNTSGIVSSLKSQTATFSRDCTLHLSFVMGTSMNISLTRINHIHHHWQSEGNSNWAPNRTLFDA